MHKNILIVAIVTMLMLSLIACQPDEDNDPNGDNSVADNGEGITGTYHASSEADDSGFVLAEVTFEDNEITDVELEEYTDKGITKGDDYGWEPFHEAMQELPDRFVEADSADIEAYSEATATSNKAMGAVEKAIQRAEGETEPFDGTFMGISEEGEDGWGITWVTLENDEIQEVQLEEVQVADEEDNEYEFKDDDYEWEPFHEAQDEMPERFEEENSHEVDTYSEATESSELWKDAVQDALNRAGRENGEEEEEDDENGE
ncbi:FMN-binding protein [Natranaerobius trueperi]|uniref:FMN-binding domain-containing protein n=1 Tax=Natranaerobius trueperi TaxID=759412 RepID=A0A226BZI1_9FIRM|nr:FMN-binding protein [Natranaerobius trueperi]OWZ84433.1 hypothetical protein CDO51_02705 [Natranaerobius trueperi]